MYNGADIILTNHFVLLHPQTIRERLRQKKSTTKFHAKVNSFWIPFSPLKTAQELGDKVTCFIHFIVS